MQLHVPTLLLVNLVITVALGISMGLVARRERRDGMVWWAWGMVTLAFSHVLLALRGQINDWLSVVLANTLLIVTFSIFAEGLCEFQRRAPRRWLIWAPAVLLPIALAGLLYEPRIRSLLSTTVLLFQAAVMLQLVWGHRKETQGRGQHFVAAGLVLIIAALLLRLGGAATGQLDLTQMTASNPVHAASLLVATLTVVVIVMGLVMMTKERADALNRSLALQDELTGLGNRRAIHRILGQQLAQARRSGRPLALLLIDVDHFKHVNDVHGHISGDKALREIAACLQDRLREQDIAGRWGGEEFIVILPDTEATGAGHFAEELRGAVEQLHVVSVVGKQMPQTISIGLHVLSPTDRERNDLIGAADRALYLAKQNGRNRVEVL